MHRALGVQLLCIFCVLRTPGQQRLCISCGRNAFVFHVFFRDAILYDILCAFAYMGRPLLCIFVFALPLDAFLFQCILYVICICGEKSSIHGLLSRSLRGGSLDVFCAVAEPLGQ